MEHAFPTTLARGQVLPLADAAGTLIRVVTGCLWITEENRNADHVVESGDAFTIRGPGLTVISALRESILG